MSEPTTVGAALASEAARLGIKIRGGDQPAPPPPEPPPEGAPPAPPPTPEEVRAARKREHAALVNRSIAEYWRRLNEGEPTGTSTYGGDVDAEDFDMDRTGRPCRVCRGKRWLRASGGTPERCFACSSPDQPDEIERRCRVAGLSLAQIGKTFDNFVPRRGTEAARAAVEDWSRGQGLPWVHIFGVARGPGGPAQGVGKTHLALAAAGAMIRAGVQCRFAYGAAIRDAWHQHREAGTLADWRAGLEAPEPLIVDDLGAAQSSEFGIEQIEGILNKRERDMLPTLITSVADPEAIKRHLSVSIGRRLQDSALCSAVGISAGQFRGEGD